MSCTNIVENGRKKRLTAEAIAAMLELPLDSEDELEMNEDDFDFSASDDDSDYEPEINGEDTNVEKEEHGENIYVGIETAEQPIVHQVTAEDSVLDWKNIPFTWKKHSLTVTEEDKHFEGNDCLPDEVMELDTPYQFFKYFFTDELMDKIIQESKLYRIQQNPNKPLVMTKDDLQKYIGICFLTSVQRNSNIRDYWKDVIGNSLIQDTMSINTFEKIRASLHFNDNSQQVGPGQPGFDKLFKIRPVIDGLLKTFNSIPMEENVSIDEQMCATKLRHHLKQYMPDKPHKWGFKLFLLCGISGYTYNFEVYSGQENDSTSRFEGEPDLGASSNIVVRLARLIPKNKKYKLYFDNYYTSVPVIVYLYKEGIFSLGTVRRNRIRNCMLPSEVEYKKMPRGSSDEYVAEIKGVSVSSVIWKDNKCVTLLSTLSGVEPMSTIRRFDKKKKIHIDIDCPNIIRFYNKHMGGVDGVDSHVGRHKIQMKSKKWYFRLFYHFLDLAIINAWTVYKKKAAYDQTKIVLNQKDFRVQVAKSLCTLGFHAQKRGRPGNEIQKQLEERQKRARTSIAPTKDVRQDSIDHWPQWNSSRNRCKLPKCTGKTFVSCAKCNTFLCFNKDKNCFKNYHQ